jgi:large conductance mechanosensitive channel
MLKGFRDFILRGNVIDLAVAVIIGTAFTSIVTAIVDGFITPLIAVIVRLPSADALNTEFFKWGDIITAIINFLLVAAVVYFLIVVPMNRVMERMRRESPADAPPAPSREEVLLAEIRDAIREGRR